MSRLTCAGVLEKNSGSHLFASDLVVLDIQIASEPKLQEKGGKQTEKFVCTALDTFNKKCTNEAGYNFICNCSDTNKSFELQFVMHL